VAEDTLARTGLRALAEAVGLDVSAELGIEDEPPAVEVDAAVVDLGPTLGALRAVSGVASRAPVLAVLWSEDQAREALGGGARGVLLRDRLGERLFSAVRAVADGLVVIDPALEAAVLRPRPTAAPLVEPLTPREMEVVQLLIEGLSNRGIAARLAISEHTAKFHVNAILGKLGAQTRAEAVAQAVRLGLVIL
jgi:DNA-binding NarL/FixJ family response regulator